MDERLQQFDTAVFGPWRAVTAAFGQHMRNVATIQTHAGRAYLEIALHNLSALNTAGRDALPPPAQQLSQAPQAAEALREQLNEDTRRLIKAHHDLLNTAGILTGDSLASLGAVAREAADELNAVAT